MRKLIVLSLITFFCLPLFAYASSIGGAETQGKGKVTVGLDQEFIIDRNMKSDGANWLNSGDYVKFVSINNLNRTMLKTSYGILDNLDIYVKLGVVRGRGEDTEYRGSGAIIGSADGKDNYKYKNALAYGIGLKGTYPLINEWSLGIDLQYLRQKNSFSGQWSDHNPVYSGSYSGRATIQEWQIAPYIAKKLGNFVPYLGVKYIDLRAKMTRKDDDEKQWEKYKADDNVGVFVGTDYKIADNWKLNLEGRFVDETAMSLGATYKF